MKNARGIAEGFSMYRRLGTLASSFFDNVASVTIPVLLAIALGTAAGLPVNAQEIVTHPIRVYSYGEFKAFAYSPDGTKIAMAHRHAVSMLNAQTLERLDTFFTTHTEDISSIAFSSDGAQIVTGSFDDKAKLLDAATGAELRTFSGHTGDVNSVAFAHNGAYVLTGSSDRTARLWNPTTGEEIKAFAGHTGGITSVAFSGDDTQILTGSWDNTAKVWNVANGRLVRTLSGHTNDVNAVAFMPDGATPVTGSSDGTVRRWDDTGTLVMQAGYGASSVAASGPFVACDVSSYYYGEVRLFDGITGQELARLPAHPTANAYTSRRVAFSPDGSRLLTGSTDARQVRLWATATLPTVKLTGHTASVNSVAFSQDGSKVLTVSSDKTAKLWDAGTGAELRTFTGHTYSVRSVAFSPDGTKILTGSDDHNAKLWDAQSGELLSTYTGHTLGVNSVAFSPGGTEVLTGSADDTAKLWDAGTGAVLRTFTGHTGYVYSVAFSPDGSRVLTGSLDKTAKLWDAGTGAELRTFTGHTSYVRSVAFSPDGTKVLTGSYDNTAKLWDAETGAVLRTFTGNTYVNSVSFSPDGSQVLTGSGDDTAKLWDAQSGMLLATYIGHTDDVSSVAFSPDGNKILTGSLDNTARIALVASGFPLASLYLGHREDVPGAALSPDGALVATGSTDDTVKVWDATSASELQRLTGHTEDVRSVAFSPDSSTILSGSCDNTARLWDAVTGEWWASLAGHTDNVNSMAFSPDGTEALTGSSDYTSRLWNLNTLTKLMTYTGHTSYVRSVAFSPDGAQVLTGSADRTARLWDAATGTELLTLSGHTGDVRSVAYSPDGTQVLTGSYDKTARLWDAATGAELHTFGRPGDTPPTGHTGSVMSVAFSPDGTKVLTGGEDRTVRLWDVRTARELRRFTGFSGYSASFSADGTKILSSGPGGLAVLWASGLNAQQVWSIALATPIDAAAEPYALEHFSLDVAAGEAANLVVRLTPARAGGEWLLLGGRGYTPSLGVYDWAGSPSGAAGTLEMLVPAPPVGRYYFSVYFSDPQNQGPTDFRIECFAAAQYVSRLSLGSGGNTGTTTVQVSGLGFASGVHVELRTAGGETVRSFNPASWNATSMTVTMDLTDLPGGVYDVAVVWPDGAQILPQAFTVSAVAMGPRLESHLEAPSPVRPARPYTLWLDYANTGDSDMPAPLFIVSSPQNVSMRLNPEDRWGTGPVQILGVNPEGAAGVLAPSAHHRIPIYFLSINTATQFNLERLTADATAVDWNALSAEVRPDGFSDEAWNAVWGKFTVRTGATWAAYLGRLDADATALGQQGRLTYDVRELIAYELADANAATGGGPVLAAALDAQCPATALPLTFARTCGASLDLRLRIGPLGRGWSHNFEYTLAFPSVDAAVILGPGGSVRRFTRPSGGAWQGELGDHGFLDSLQDGTYKLSEPDGVSLAFNAAGQLTSVQEPNGNAVTLTYTGGQLTGIAHSNGGAFTLDYNAQGRIRQLTNQAGEITTYAYDGSGQHLIAVTAPGDVTTGYSYILASGPIVHALQSVTFRDGTHEYFGYDSAGRLSGRWLDDNAERVDVAYEGPGSVTATDAAGAESWFFYGPSSELLRFRDPLGNEVRSQYDRTLNLTSITLPDESTTELRYDDRGHLIHAIDPLGNSITSGYTGRPERLDWLRDPNGNLTDFTYDASANLTRTTYPNNGYEQFGYAAGGNMTSYVNRRWQTIGFTYNARGQVTQKNYPGGRSIAYAYDDAGRLTAATDASGATTLEYDARGFLTAIQYPSGHGFVFSYNDAGQRIQRVGDDGYTLNYEYDANGRLACLSDGEGVEIVRYEYDVAGRLSQEIKGNGTYTTYDYDDAGRILSLVNYAPDGEVQSHFDYTYDTNGNPITMTTLDGVTAYEYDALGQLTGVTYPGGRHVVYEYDPAGNRKRVIDNGVATVYTANNLNQYTKVGDTTYTYDFDGNMTSKTDTTGVTAYTYDEENRLIKVVNPTDGTWDYTYDALGNRATVSHDGETTSYVHDPAGLVDVAAEYDAAGELSARNLHGAGLVARESADGNVGYYAYDATGHTRQVSEAAGTVANEYDYDPFGEVLSSNESIPNPFQYVGRFGVAADGNGLIFMRSRYYSPESGKFLTPDVFGFGGGDANLYRYGLNNPISNIDPSGLSFIESIYVGSCLLLKIPVQTYGNWGGPGRVNGQTGTWTEDMRFPRQGEPGFVRPIDRRDWAYYHHDVNLNDARMIADPQMRQASRRRADQILAAELAMVNGQFGNTWFEELLFGGEHSPNNNPGSYSGTVPPVPPPSQRTPDASVASFPVRPIDPNEKVSPRGTGTESERFIPADAAIPYTVYFENVSTASAAAQVVEVTDILAPGLDASTFRLSGIVWGDHEVTIPEGTASFYARETVMDYRPGVDKSWWVDVTVDVDYGSGRVQCTLETLDPETGELPTDVHAGFLPPNDGAHRGEGHVLFTVMPKAGIAPGARIANTATIVFDTESSMTTNEVFNTIETPSANQPPVLTNPGGQSGVEGRTISLQIQATDPDEDTLSYGAQDLPSGLSINPFTGLISGTLAAGSTGIHTVTVTVSDSQLDDTEQFTWTVVEGVTVPNVVGMTQANAEAAILAAGLTVGAATEQYSATVAAGEVISQDPMAGASAAAGMAVALVVSKGPLPVAVPNVVGMTQAAAETAILAAGLTVGAVTEEYSATIVLGKVISQDPSAGEGVAPNSVVALVVSKGPEPVSVPNVVGMTQVAARTAILAAGLTEGAMTESYSDTVAVGIVISQDPLAGASVAPGTAIALVVSKGLEPGTVPNIVGMTQAAAETAILAAGLTVGAVTEAYSDTVAAGSVISQDPLAGASVASGTAVAFVVSKGPELKVAPNVVGMTQAAAQTAITAAGLTVGAVTESFSDTVAAGIVISQDPLADANVASGTAVALVVSKGAPPVVVPNVVGMTQAAAQTAITAAGLTVGAVTESFSDTVAAGIVISQDPLADASVASGTAVALVVSKGAPELKVVPNVVGMTQAAAQTAITAAGLTVGTVSESYSDTVAAGIVISQDPLADASVAAGTAVALVVSKGAPELKVVPNVVGMTQAAAQTAITAAGLTAGAVTESYSDTVVAGSVISQNPLAGTSVAAGTAIALVVSKGPQPVAVPNVVGMTQVAALTAIMTAGLTVGAVTEEFSDTIPAGNVISQNPAAGANVNPDTPVSLVLSKGAVEPPSGCFGGTSTPSKGGRSIPRAPGDAAGLGAAMVTLALGGRMKKAAISGLWSAK